MLNLQELLFSRGFSKESRVKILRHTRVLRLQGYRGKQWNLVRLLEEHPSHFDYFQASWPKPAFDGCDYVIPFIAEEKAGSRLLGVYRVGPCQRVTNWPDGFPYPDMPKGGLQYELERQPGFEDIEGRVIIKWPSAAIVYLQRLSVRPVEVIEVLPTGFVQEFTGYEDFFLPFLKLKALLANATANHKWRQMLSKVAGVYLITCEETGAQYVGSAYGKEGIWGRWEIYVKTGGHGNNVILKELLKDHPERANRFSFTLLRTLPWASTKDEAIRFEKLYKDKLGRLACSLNGN